MSDLCRRSSLGTGLCSAAPTRSLSPAFSLQGTAGEASSALRGAPSSSGRFESQYVENIRIAQMSNATPGCPDYSGTSHLSTTQQHQQQQQQQQENNRPRVVEYNYNPARRNSHLQEIAFPNTNITFDGQYPRAPTDDTCVAPSHLASFADSGIRSNDSIIKYNVENSVVLDIGTRPNNPSPRDLDDMSSSSSSSYESDGDGQDHHLAGYLSSGDEGAGGVSLSLDDVDMDLDMSEEMIANYDGFSTGDSDVDETSFASHSSAGVSFQAMAHMLAQQAHDLSSSALDLEMEDEYGSTSDSLTSESSDRYVFQNESSRAAAAVPAHTTTSPSSPFLTNPTASYLSSPPGSSTNDSGLFFSLSNSSLDESGNGSNAFSQPQSLEPMSLPGGNFGPTHQPAPGPSYSIPVAEFESTPEVSDADTDNAVDYDPPLAWPLPGPAPIAPFLDPVAIQSSINLPLTWTTGPLDDDGAEQELEAYPFEDFERNPDVGKFLETWRVHHGLRHPGFAPIGPEALHVRDWTRADEITRDDLQGDQFDAQGIDWEKLGTTRSAARQARGKLYTNYTNLRNVYPSKYAQDLPETENFFQFRRMDTTKHPFLTHFQLRNLICASSKNDVYYAGKSRVYCTNPSLRKESCVMDLTKPSISTVYPGGLRISTISATDGVLIAGGFGGEYAMTSLTCDYNKAHVEGLVSSDDKGITNHVHTFLDRFNSHPNAVFSSNDGKVRVLDCYSNRFTREHSYGYPINCAATSPDGRLRVVVGDDTAVVISDAETGENIETLRGHRDYGFACAWADDGIHVATGNQDTQVYIYDARMFRHPLQIIASEMAGVRALRFSPVGGGRRVLLMAEPADIVSVVDAESFTTKQKLDLFGEIGGISFTPDGSEFFVANTDETFGGLMEYERVGFGAQYGMKYTRQREIEDCGDKYWDEKDFEWIPDEALSDDDRVKRAGAQRSRRGLDLGNLMY